jgi:hypothetical protein
MTLASGFQIRKLVTPRLPKSPKLSRAHVAQIHSLLPEIRAIVSESLAGKERFSDDS